MALLKPDINNPLDPNQNNTQSVIQQLQNMEKRQRQFGLEQRKAIEASFFEGNFGRRSATKEHDGGSLAKTPSNAANKALSR
jgi:hypothetical protein